MSHYATHLNYTGDRLSGFERLRTDNGQTGFFEGREFRSFHEFSIPTGTAIWLRFVSPVPFILFGQDLAIDNGGVRLNAMADATPAGVWTNLPVVGKNRMPERRAPYYEGQATIATGGTGVGGTVVETIRAFAGGPGANQQTVGGGVQDERGLPAGTYLLHLNSIGTGDATGVYSIWWEERAKHPDWKTTP